MIASAERLGCVEGGAREGTSGGGGPRVLCPFCGVSRGAGAEACARCGRADSEAEREAALRRVGPWFVMDGRRPWLGGVTLGEMRRMIRVGEVSRGSVVRGPTTGQFWQYAAEVKGLSREFGLCYLCHEDIEPQTVNCPTCGAGQAGPEEDCCLLERGRGAEEQAGAREAVAGRALTDMGGMGATGAEDGAATLPAQAGEGARPILTAEQLQNAFRVPAAAGAEAGGARGRRRPWGAVWAGVVVVILGVVAVGVLRPEVRKDAGAWAGRQVGRVAHFVGTLRGGGGE